MMKSETVPGIATFRAGSASASNGFKNPVSVVPCTGGLAVDGSGSPKSEGGALRTGEVDGKGAEDGSGAWPEPEGGGLRKEVMPRMQQRAERF